MKKVLIFTDGACKGNPGAGGWGTILRSGGVEKEISGGERETTNNRMEMTAVIKGLEKLKVRCKVFIYSDSKYIVDAINKGWALKWKENNWYRNKKDKALNIDLWERLLLKLEDHECEIGWVKGHSGHKENERCDRLAVMEAEKYL